MQKTSSFLLFASAAVALGHKAEISSLPNAKVALVQPLGYKRFKTTLMGNYDFDAKRRFMKDAAIAGTVPAGPVKLAYKATYSFVKSKMTLAVNGKVGSTVLTTNMEGSTPVKATMRHSAKAGDLALILEPAWLIKANSAALSTTASYGSKKKVSATIDVSLKGDISYDVSYEQPLSSGRVAAATVMPHKQKLSLKYVDSLTEPGTTWTAKAVVKTNSWTAQPAIDVSRAWSF